MPLNPIQIRNNIETGMEEQNFTPAEIAYKRALEKYQQDQELQHWNRMKNMTPEQEKLYLQQPEQPNLAYNSPEQQAIRAKYDVDERNKLPPVYDNNFPIKLK